MRHLTIHLFLLYSVLLPFLARAQVLANPHFYSLVSPSGKESFLLGTVHRGVEISELPPAVIQKFNHSKALMTEAVLSEEEVESILSGQLIELQIKKFKHRGFNLTIEEKIRLTRDWKMDPRLANKIKSQDCSLLSSEGAPTSGFMDVHLMDMARKQNKSLFGLDSDKQFDQLKRQNSVQPCDIRKMIKSLSPEDYQRAQLEFYDEYRRGSPIESESDPITEGRNLFWLPKILNHADKGNLFIAVGFFHLYGPKGLIHLLQKQGYQVSRWR